MFCSLFGISPCDAILQDIDARTMQSLLRLLNNRFDSGVLRNVQAEFRYVWGVLNKMVFDYDRREDRILSKKLAVPGMTTFDGMSREEVEARLADAEKSFTGNIVVNGSTVAVENEGVREILMELHRNAGRIWRFSETVKQGDFTDLVFFGKPLTWWANSRSHSWLSVYAAKKLEMRDNLASMKRDAINLLAYVDDAEADAIGEVKPPELEDVRVKFAQLSGGEEMDGKEQELAQRFADSLAERKLSAIGAPAVSSLVTAFVYSLLGSRMHDDEVAAGLERCGLYFMNPVKAEFMLDSMNDLTLVPERRIVLRNLEVGDRYEVILNAIIAACDNDAEKIGQKFGGE